VSLWSRRTSGAGATGSADPWATQVVAGRTGATGTGKSTGKSTGKWSSKFTGKSPKDPARRDRRSAGVVSLGTVVTVVGALSASLLGGGLATRHSDILDGNTWIVAASRDGVERLLRVNPGSSEVDLDTPSPLPAGRSAQLQQSNVTTAVVDASTGDTFAWDPVGGHWQKSSTRVSGNTALHLTTTAAFTVDRTSGTVRQLDPTLLSAPIGPALSLHANVSDSVVDGSGQLWLAMPQIRQVVAVQGGASGPSVGREFKLPSSGSLLTLTALQSGVLVGDPTGRTSYRLIPGSSAAERIAGAPNSTSALSAASSDDDSGAVLDPSAGTVTRVVPKDDQRAQSIRLGAGYSGDQFGRPVVFGDRVYVPDYTAGKVLRSSPGGGVEAFPPQRLTDGGAEFDLFVDDGRLWVNGRDEAKAYSVDESGRWTPVAKFQRQRIKPPKVTATRSAPSTAPDPQIPKDSGKSGRPPVKAGEGPKKPTGPAPDPTTAKPTPKPTTPSPTPAPPPDAPANLAAAPGDKSLDLTWKAPAHGAAEVTGYTVEWTGANGSSDSTTRPKAARDYSIPELTNGVAYTVKVTAVNARGQGDSATVSATPVTTAGVELQSVAANGRGRIQVNYAVDQKGSGDVTCQILVGGTSKWSGACDGASSQTIAGLAAGTGYSVQVKATNPQGDGSSAVQSVTTWPAPEVTINKGPSAQGQGTPVCHDRSCAWIEVKIKYFDPGQSYSLTADDNHPANGDGSGSFPPRTITAGSDGTADIWGAGKTYYFGYQGYQVWAFVDGLQSNKINW
jgi:Fibronectin type III domain